MRTRRRDPSWSLAGGANAAAFRLTAGGVPTFASAEDYEAPGDADCDRDYEVSVEVTDGANPVTGALTVRGTDEQDTSRALTGRPTISRRSGGGRHAGQNLPGQRGGHSPDVRGACARKSGGHCSARSPSRSR